MSPAGANKTTKSGNGPLREKYQDNSRTKFKLVKGSSVYWMSTAMLSFFIINFRRPQSCLNNAKKVNIVRLPTMNQLLTKRTGVSPVTVTPRRERHANPLHALSSAVRIMGENSTKGQYLTAASSQPLISTSINIIKDN